MPQNLIIREYILLLYWKFKFSYEWSSIIKVQSKLFLLRLTHCLFSTNEDSFSLEKQLTNSQFILANFFSLYMFTIFNWIFHKKKPVLFFAPSLETVLPVHLHTFISTSWPLHPPHQREINHVLSKGLDILKIGFRVTMRKLEIFYTRQVERSSITQSWYPSTS